MQWQVVRTGTVPRGQDGKRYVKGAHRPTETVQGISRTRYWKTEMITGERISHNRDHDDIQSLDHKLFLRKSHRYRENLPPGT